MFEKLKAVFRDDRGIRLFLISLFVTGTGYGMYKGIIDNYFAEIVKIGEFDRGVIEFCREVPGFLLIAILAALYMFSAEKLYKLGAVIMMIGMGMLSLVSPGKLLVTMAVCIISLGEHIQLGMKNTLALEYSRESRGGEALGYQQALYQIGTLIGFVVIIFSFFFFTGSKPYKPFFAASTLLMGASMILALGMTSNSQTDSAKRKLYFRKKFTKFYMLELFYGARKQVFFTFGPYVLILFYGASATTISILFAVSALLSFFLSPVIGKIIDRLGYRIVMISDTLILVVVCFFYGFAHHIFTMNVAFIICCLNYILDSIISLASMASNVYVQDISDSNEEMRATISTGISVNHLVTLLISLFGGWIWQTLGIETLFMLSAFLGLCNSAYAATIKTGRKQDHRSSNYC